MWHIKQEKTKNVTFFAMSFHVTVKKMSVHSNPLLMKTKGFVYDIRPADVPLIPINVVARKYVSYKCKRRGHDFVFVIFFCEDQIF